MLLGNFLTEGEAAGRGHRRLPRRARARQRAPERALQPGARLQGRGALDEARVGFERARELDPRNGKVLWQLADLWMRQGEPGRAEAIVTDALARKVDEHRLPAEARREPDRGEALRRGREERSRRRSRRSPTSTPRTSTSASSTRSRARSSRRSPPTRRSWRTNPKAYRAAFNLAKLLQKTGAAARRRSRYFRKAVEIEPDFGTGQLYLAKALLDAGDLAGAEQWARSGSPSKPEPSMAPLGHYVLADVYNRKGRAIEADREVAAAKRLPRGKPRARRCGGGLAVSDAGAMMQGLTVAGRIPRHGAGAGASTSERTVGPRPMHDEERTQALPSRTKRPASDGVRPPQLRARARRGPDAAVPLGGLAPRVARRGRGRQQLRRVRVHPLPFRIGRRPGLELVLAAESVSKTHAEIYWADDGLHLRDLESTNGTFLNRQAIKDVALHEGDILHFADFEFRLAQQVEPRRRSRTTAKRSRPRSPSATRSCPASSCRARAS